METGTQIVIGSLATVCSGGFLTFILRGMHYRIKNKVKTDLCDEKHKHVNSELVRGEKQFKKIINTQEKIIKDLGTLNTSVAVLVERSNDKD